MSNREKAVALAKMGFRVFVLPVNAKSPPVTNFPEVATNDVTGVMEKWTGPFGESRDNNIGISTDDLLTLDFDVKAGRELMEREFEAFNKAYKFKHVVQTTSGGYHVYFKLPPGVRVASTAKKLGESVDTRSWHGYVVGPGSDINHMPYAWLVSVQDEFIEPAGVGDLALAPPDLIEACGAPAEKAAQSLAIEWDEPAALTQAKEYLIHHAPEAKMGEGGDEITYKVACRVRDFGVSQTQCFVLLGDHWNYTKADPPWGSDELERKVENAYAYAKGNPHVPGSEYEAVDIGNPISEPVSAKGAKKRKTQRESFQEVVARALAEKDAPLVVGLLDCGTLALLSGESNAGKSFIAIEIGRCVAMGVPFAGRKTKKGAVLYYALEAEKTVPGRFAVVSKHKACGADIPMALYTGQVNLFTDRKGEDTETILEDIKDQENKTGLSAGLVIFDTLVRLASGADENGVQDMGPVMERAEAIANQTGATVLVVHHLGKDKTKGARGSSAIYAALDTELRAEANKKVPGEPLSGYVRTGKQRAGEFAADIHYVLVQKDFDFDSETLQPRTSCVVEFPPESQSRVMLDRWEAFELATGRVGANEWVCLDDLHKASEELRAREGKPTGSKEEAKRRRESLRAAATRMYKSGQLLKKGQSWKRPVKQ